jgi:hypothetical protein
MGMSLIPLAELDELAALLGIRPYDPADENDLAVLRDLLARREALAAQRRAAGPPPVPPPPWFIGPWLPVGPGSHDRGEQPHP